MKESAGRILMLVENSYPADTRVRNEANLLTSSGYNVSVICLRKPGERATEEVNGVRVYRIPRLEFFKKTAEGQPGWLGVLFLKLKSFLGYVLEYSYFTTACLLTASYVFVKRGFDVIHAHNPPDTLFVVALPFKLLGKKFVFDHHDLSPELYRSRYGAGEGLLTRMLRITEWCSLKLADVTIATNESYKAAQIERAKRNPNSIFIVRNGPDQRRMSVAAPNPKLRALNKCILCYIGSLNPQDGVDYLLRSLHHLRHEMKRTDFYCVIMGSGDSLEDLQKLAKDLSLDDCLELTGFVSEEELRSNLAAADICVDPDPSSPLNDVSTWIKIMEYMAYSKPIVSFDLKETRFSAQDAALFVAANDEKAFAGAIAELMDKPKQRLAMGEFGRRRVEQHLQWSVVGQNLVTAYASL
jgi:glycosyltransferase involved in cell wall biosynthesis